MIERKSANMVMPDLQRMGGVTDSRRVIANLNAAKLRYSPHLFTEHSLHLVTDGCQSIEHMPWFAPLFREQLTLDENGMLDIPKRPRTGLSLDFDPIQPHLF